MIKHLKYIGILSVAVLAIDSGQNALASPSQEEIKAFIQANANNPAAIAAAMQQYGVSIGQIAEATGSSQTDVTNYVNNSGNAYLQSTLSIERNQAEAERYNREYAAALAAEAAGQRNVIFPTTGLLPRESQRGYDPISTSSSGSSAPAVIDEITQIRLNQVNAIADPFRRQTAMQALNRELELEGIGNQYILDYNRRVQEANASGTQRPAWGWANGTTTATIGQSVLDTQGVNDLDRHNEWLCLTGGIGCSTSSGSGGSVQNLGSGSSGGIQNVNYVAMQDYQTGSQQSFTGPLKGAPSGASYSPCSSSSPWKTQ